MTGVLTRSRRWTILVACCMSLVIVSMDHTITNVALQAIHADLHASVSGLQWTIDAYTMVIACLLVLSGSLADRIGRRKVFRAGLVLFTLGSLLCSVAPSLGWLVTFRMMQAIGGSMLNPVAMSIIINVFTERRERALAIGAWGGCVGIGYALGPIIGGVTIDTVGWRGIFWINVPIGVAAFVLATLYIPESRAIRPRRLDPTGQLLVIITLATLIYAIIEAPRRGWSDISTVAFLAVSVVGAVSLVIIELGREQPLVEMRFFRSVPFSGAALTAICAYGAFDGFLFLNTLYLQDVRGYSALAAGTCTLPIAVGALVSSPVSGRLLGTRGPRSPLVVSGAAIAACGVMLFAFSRHTPLLWVLATYAVLSIGFGMINPPVTDSAVSGMPLSQAGVAAAMSSTCRNIGAALGVAVVGAVFNSGLDGRSVDAGFGAASHSAWWIVIGCGLAVVGLGIATTGRWARSTVERTAHLLDD
jgi:EmrB/QacA subfamily drug resistance transporter